MSALNYIWLSITRRLNKSIVIFLSIFILGNVLCASLFVNLSCNQLKDEFVSSLGIITEIKKIINSDENQQEIYDIEQEMNQLNEESILYKDISYKMNGYTSDMLVTNEQYYEQNKENYQIPVTIYGTNLSLPFDEIKNSIVMTQGRGFSQNEIDDGVKVAIVSEQYKIVKDGVVSTLQLGDTLQLNTENKNEKFKIVGIFKPAEVLSEEDSYKIPYKVYVPNETLIKLEMNLEEQGKKIDYFGIKLSSPKDSEYFKKEFDFDIINHEHFDIIYSEDVYEKIAAPLENLSTISSLFLKVSFSAVFLILSSILFIYVKERKHEFGVLAALGERKHKILFKTIVEVFIIAQLALSLAIVSGYKIGDLYSNVLIENQKDTVYEVAYGYSSESIIESFEIEMNIVNIFHVYALVSADIMISCVIPMMYILKLKPRKILLK